MPAPSRRLRPGDATLRADAQSQKVLTRLPEQHVGVVPAGGHPFQLAPPDHPVDGVAAKLGIRDASISLIGAVQESTVSVMNKGDALADRPPPAISRSS